MSNIVIDIGNSRIKAAVFKGSILESKWLFYDISELEGLFSKPHDHVIVASVKNSGDDMLRRSVAKGKKIGLSSKTPLPIQIKYATPHSLGVDRIGAVCGAYQLFPNKNCLIVDVGTCINYEFLDRDGNYWGGIISPGINMRFKAMHTFTAQLPLLEGVKEPELIGNTTTTCLQSGVMNGILEEIKGIIGRMRIKYPTLKVLLCGGDATFFENQLKPSIFAAPELVLIGLNRILLHNVQN